MTEGIDRTNLRPINNNRDLVNYLVEKNHAANYYILSKCIINFSLDVDNGTLVEFETCVFTKTVTFSPGLHNNKVKINNCEFSKNVNFKDVIFRIDVQFWYTIFREQTSFNNTSFSMLADFMGSQFIKPIVFYRTDFKEVAVFSGVKFWENVRFVYTPIEKTLIFRETHFEKGLDLALALIQGKINIFDIHIKNFTTPKLRVERTAFNNQLEQHTETITTRDKQETFRILKQHLRNDGSEIDAMEFSILEKKAYHEMLKGDIGTNDRRNYNDYIIFILNWGSNDHGKRWWQAFLLTIGFGWIFFYFSLLNTCEYTFSIYEFSNLGEGTKLFFEFLIPTHKVDYLEAAGLSPNWGSYVLDFLGRLVVLYGIYQTISAFRKFKGT